MPNPATVADIEERWRPLAGREVINANAFLADAWDHLLEKRPNLESDLEADTVKESSVIRVVATAALRVLKNPDGWDQESIDDWSGRRNKLVADGILRLTPDELAAATPAPSTPRRHSVRLVVYGDA